MKKVKINLSIVFACFCNFIYSADTLDGNFCEQSSKSFRQMCVSNNDKSKFVIKRTYNSPKEICTEIEFFKEPDEDLVCEIFQLLQYMDHVAFNETEEFLDKLKQTSRHKNDGIDSCATGTSENSQKIVLQWLKHMLDCE